jgi:hypothetical protein
MHHINLFQSHQNGGVFLANSLWMSWICKWAVTKNRCWDGQNFGDILTLAHMKKILNIKNAYIATTLLGDFWYFAWFSVGRALKNTRLLYIFFNLFHAQFTCSLLPLWLLRTCISWFADKWQAFFKITSTWLRRI